jgi:midasin (ATPase involved in ribosome maturation)
MQIVAFDAQGGVAISPYLDGYPFPCYVVLRDVRELPETLAAALKQWFEFHHAA